MCAMHTEMSYLKFPGAVLVKEKQYVGLIRLRGNMYLALSSSLHLLCC